MTWTAPMTWIDGATLTAAQLNTNLRDNFLEQIPAKSTNNGGAGAGYFTIAGPHSLRERGVAIKELSSSQSTTSNKYTDLSSFGPSVSAITTTKALVMYSADSSSNTNGKLPRCSVEVSGATVIGANDKNAIFIYTAANAPVTLGNWLYFNDLTPGLNIFTMKYAASEGTATFSNRRLHVFPL